MHSLRTIRRLDRRRSAALHAAPITLAHPVRRRRRRRRRFAPTLVVLCLFVHSRLVSDWDSVLVWISFYFWLAYNAAWQKYLTALGTYLDNLGVINKTYYYTVPLFLSVSLCHVARITEACVRCSKTSRKRRPTTRWPHISVVCQRQSASLLWLFLCQYYYFCKYKTMMYRRRIRNCESLFLKNQKSQLPRTLAVHVDTVCILISKQLISNNVCSLFRCRRYLDRASQRHRLVVGVHQIAQYPMPEIDREIYASYLTNDKNPVLLFDLVLKGEEVLLFFSSSEINPVTYHPLVMVVQSRSWFGAVVAAGPWNHARNSRARNHLVIPLFAVKMSVAVVNPDNRNSSGRVGRWERPGTATTPLRYGCKTDWWRWDSFETNTYRNTIHSSTDSRQTVSRNVRGLRVHADCQRRPPPDARRQRAHRPCGTVLRRNTFTLNADWWIFVITQKNENVRCWVFPRASVHGTKIQQFRDICFRYEIIITTDAGISYDEAWNWSVDRRRAQRRTDAHRHVVAPERCPLSVLPRIAIVDFVLFVFERNNHTTQITENYYINFQVFCFYRNIFLYIKWHINHMWQIEIFFIETRRRSERQPARFDETFFLLLLFKCHWERTIVVNGHTYLKVDWAAYSKAKGTFKHDVVEHFLK